MIEKLRDILLVATLCSFVIENLPMISMSLGVAYLFLSLVCSLHTNTLYLDNLHKSIGVSWFVLFAYLTMLTMLIPCNRTDLPVFNWKWLRAIMFFILFYRDTKNKPLLQKNALFFYAITSVICSVLMSMGIGISAYAEQFDIGHVRLTFLGTNSNKMAMFYTYGIAVLLYYIEVGWFWNISKKIRYVISGVLIIILCYGIALTGSRGAYFVVIAMLGYYIIFYQKGGGVASKIVITAIASVFAYYLIDLMNNVDVFSRRMEMTSEGQHGERDVLADAAFKVFEDHPMGVGLNRVYDYMLFYVGDSKTPHNYFAYMLAAGGILGISLFLSIVWRIVKCVYVRYKAKRLLLPVLLLITTLMDFNKNGGSLTFSINYCMLALALSMSKNEEL